MGGTTVRHLDEETGEQYSLRRLSARRTREAEEHLLVCARCRRVVAASDQYVAAMRQAAARLRGAPRKAQRKRTRKSGANG